MDMLSYLVKSAAYGFNKLLLGAICSLVLVCCSCQKKPRRIVFSPQHLAAANSGHESIDHKKYPKDNIRPDHSSQSLKKNTLNSSPLERESKLTDIPILPKAQPILEYFTAQDQTDGTSIGYCVEQNRSLLITFYQRQMANFGWRLQGQVDGAESVLLFKKPDRICIVSLRNYHKSAHMQQLVITVINKKEPRL